MHLMMCSMSWTDEWMKGDVMRTCRYPFEVILHWSVHPNYLMRPVVYRWLTPHPQNTPAFYIQWHKKRQQNNNIFSKNKLNNISAKNSFKFFQMFMHLEYYTKIILLNDLNAWLLWFILMMLWISAVKTCFSLKKRKGKGKLLWNLMGTVKLFFLPCPQTGFK